MNGTSEAYPLGWEEAASAFFSARSADLDLETLGLTRQTRRILDVGCGQGALLKRIQEHFRGIKGVGLDASAEAIARARRQYHDRDLEFHIGDAASLPFPTAHFDLTFCHTVLIYVPHPHLAVQEMARVTRPGGRVVLLGEGDWRGFSIEPPCPALQALGDRFIRQVREQGGNPDLGSQLQVLLEKAGLVDIEVGENRGSGSLLSGAAFTEAYGPMIRSFAQRQLADPEGRSPIAEEMIRSIQRWGASPGSFLRMPRSFYGKATRA